MTKPAAPAAITAKLVDVRNIAAHKCVRLEIHVPYEEAPKVMEAFGWPTFIEPVDVAIARLDTSKFRVISNDDKPAIADHQTKERKSFSSLPLSQQIGIRCADPEFVRFCESREDYHRGNYHVASDPIAEYVRDWCGVKSRADIQHGTEAARLFKELDDNFWFYKRGELA